MTPLTTNSSPCQSQQSEIYKIIASRKLQRPQFGKALQLYRETKSAVYLAVEELEEVERDAVEAVVDGRDDGLDGALDVVDAGAERPGALLGVRVRRGCQHQRLSRGQLHELQVPQPLLLSRRRVLPLHRHFLLRGGPVVGEQGVVGGCGHGGFKDRIGERLDLIFACLLLGIGLFIVRDL